MYELSDAVEYPQNSTGAGEQGKSPMEISPGKETQIIFSS